jgi:hypothetical protein
MQGDILLGVHFTSKLMGGERERERHTHRECFTNVKLSYTKRIHTKMCTASGRPTVYAVIRDGMCTGIPYEHGSRKKSRQKRYNMMKLF